MVYLSPKNIARGMTLTIRSGDEKIEFHDVSAGEVWFAGGQSNMELELVNSLHGESAVAGSSHSDIRFYMTPKCAATGEELREQEAGAGWQSPFRPAGLFYSMVQRIRPYAIRGFLYYQGEEDEAKYADYDWMMISLIREWRSEWKDDQMPFLFVQLPMYIAKAQAVQGIDNRHWAMKGDKSDMKLGIVGF